MFSLFSGQQSTGKPLQDKKWKSEFTVGDKNVNFKPLIEQSKVLMPPLHIKLGLIKQFVGALQKELDAFKYLKTIFSKFSLATITTGVFTGPQIRN